LTGQRKIKQFFKATASPPVAVARISGFVAEVSEKYGVDEWGNFSGCAGAGRPFLFYLGSGVWREGEWGRRHGSMSARADLEEEQVRGGYLRGYKSVGDFFGRYLKFKVGGDGGRSISLQTKARNALFEE